MQLIYSQWLNLVYNLFIKILYLEFLEILWETTKKKISQLSLKNLMQGKTKVQEQI